MASKVLEVEFRAKDSMSAALKAAGLSAEQTARKLKEIDSASKSQGSGGKSKGEGGGDSSLLEKARESLGEERSFSRLFRGGAAGFIGEQLNQATEKIAEVVKQFREGKASAGEMVEEIGKGIPIFGGFFSAALNVREMITGEKAEAEKLTNLYRLRNQLDEHGLQVMQAQAERLRSIRDIVQQITNRRTLAGKEGVEAEQYARAFAANDRVKALTEKRDADLKKSREEMLQDFKAINDLKVNGQLSPKDAAEQIEKVKKDGRDRATALQKSYADALNKERETTAAEDQAFTRKQLTDSQNLVNRHEQELSADQAKARAERLRTLGLSGQAELVEIKTQAKQKKAELQRQYDEEKKTTAAALQPALAGNLRRRLAEVDAEAAQQQQDAQFKHQQDTAKRLRDSQQQLLDEAAEQATKPAEKLEAKRKAEAFRLQNEMRDRAKALREVLQDPLASDKEKQAAQDQFKQFVSQAGREYDRKTLGPAADVAHLANLSESMTLTGVSAAASERTTANDPAQKTAQHTEASVKLQTDLNSKFDQFLRLAQQGAQQGQSNPLFDY